MSCPYCAETEEEKESRRLFVADCRRIEEWAKEEGLLWLEYINARPGQKLGVDFTLADLPSVELDLPSRRKARAPVADQTAQSSLPVEDLSTPRV